jgi:hypothetical protein
MGERKARRGPNCQSLVTSNRCSGEDSRRVSVAAKKGASLAGEREPVVRLRSGHFSWSCGPATAHVFCSQFVPVPGNLHPVSAQSTAHGSTVSLGDTSGRDQPGSATHGGCCLKPVRVSALRPARTVPKQVPHWQIPTIPSFIFQGLLVALRQLLHSLLQARKLSEVIS